MKSSKDWAEHLVVGETGGVDVLTHNAGVIYAARSEAYREGQRNAFSRSAEVCPERTGKEWVRDSLWDQMAQRMKSLIGYLEIQDLDVK